MTDTPDNDDRTVRPFSAWLLEQRGGIPHSELSAALPDLVEAVTTYGKPGTLTLKITVKPADGDRGAVIVADEVTLKAPGADRPVAMFFVDADHNLTRENPFHLPLPVLREVPTSAAPATDAPNAQEA